ncbi:helix-turn-helix domain-containing protein [Thermomicrobium sp. CFH 73360]|uniref:helix-turn-helix domain-containing protein n=1 Tax=Thermomicrobium sp. CFH 73360 TaxID=2951987 RepID=UPI00207768E8|nr:helix-turn-helix domain-containing protein [Thermomicrobium sp. CFH 73360]MCM8746781.1 helix-turn-helix domain-containing protein [Thermomicrobium sp. CFH 73360]
MPIAYSSASRSTTVSVGEAAQLLGVGRSLAYELARWQGQLAPGVPVIRVGGRRYRVPVRPLAQALGIDEDELLARLGREGRRDA